MPLSLFPPSEEWNWNDTNKLGITLGRGIQEVPEPSIKILGECENLVDNNYVAVEKADEIVK